MLYVSAPSRRTHYGSHRATLLLLCCRWPPNPRSRTTTTWLPGCLCPPCQALHPCSPSSTLTRLLPHLSFPVPSHQPLGTLTLRITLFVPSPNCRPHHGLTIAIVSPSYVNTCIPLRKPFLSSSSSHEDAWNDDATSTLIDAQGSALWHWGWAASAPATVGGGHQGRATHSGRRSPRSSAPATTTPRHPRSGMTSVTPTGATFKASMTCSLLFSSSILSWLQ